MAITRQESAAWDQHLHGQFDTVVGIGDSALQILREDLNQSLTKDWNICDAFNSFKSVCTSESII